MSALDNSKLFGPPVTKGMMEVFEEESDTSSESEEIIRSAAPLDILTKKTLSRHSRNGSRNVSIDNTVSPV